MVIAYKYKPESAITGGKLKRMWEERGGYTGALTPVFLAGTTIKNATLHNYDEIERLGVREGDYVQIEKGGEIIPKVVSVIIDKRSPESHPFQPPSQCPSCGSLLGKLEGEVALRCFNGSCPAQRRASLEHFVSRSAMDIRHVGPSLVEHLLKWGLVENVADLYELTVDKLTGLERMGQKSASNVIESIQKSKNNSLDKLLHGLGIRMVGAQAARSWRTIYQIFQIYLRCLLRILKIETIGPAMAQSIECTLTGRKTLRLSKIGQSRCEYKRYQCAQEEIQRESFCADRNTRSLYKR